MAEIQQEGTYLRNAFFEWLAKEVPANRLTELKQSAAELEEYCANKKLLSSSLFTVSDKASITRLRVRLEGDRLFKFFNRGKSERMFEIKYCRSSSGLNAKVTVSPKLIDFFNLITYQGADDVGFKVIGIQQSNVHIYVDMTSINL